jgi:molecular chaperone GrpE
MANRRGLPRERARRTPAALPEPSLSQGTVLSERLADLMGSVRDFLVASDERAATRERIIDWLHADNERLRSAERHVAVRPFLIDLHRLRDDLLRQASALRADGSTGDMPALLESFAYNIEQTLARGGVEVMRPEIGSQFDASRQRAAGAVPASRAELDGTVAEVLSDGYLDTTVDRALASATVRVYRCESPLDPSRAEPGGTPHR